MCSIRKNKRNNKRIKRYYKVKILFINNSFDNRKYAKKQKNTTSVELIF